MVSNSRLCPQTARSTPASTMRPVTQTPASWYPDPWEQAAQRWWDGAAWTGHVAAKGSLLDCPSLTTTYRLHDRSCSLTDAAGAVAGIVELAGGAPAGTGPTAAPRAGALEIAPQGDGFGAAATSPPFGPPGFAVPAVPVPVRDAAGALLFTLQPDPPGARQRGMGATLLGPDGTEVGRYSVGAGQAKAIDLAVAGVTVATASGEKVTGSPGLMTVRGRDGGAIATGQMRRDVGAQPSFSITMTIAPASLGPVRALAVTVPVALVAVMTANIPAMPMAMPGPAGSFPSGGDMLGRIASMALEGLFSALTGGD